jgi:hypothetical protein
METTIRTKQYGGEIILPNLTSEAGAKTYGPPCESKITARPKFRGRTIRCRSAILRTPVHVGLREQPDPIMFASSET